MQGRAPALGAAAESTETRASEPESGQDGSESPDLATAGGTKPPPAAAAQTGTVEFSTYNGHVSDGTERSHLIRVISAKVGRLSVGTFSTANENAAD